MRFGELSPSQAEGAILAHSCRVAGERWTKGRVLTGTDVSTLIESGIERITVAQLDADDVPEDEAAASLAAALAGRGVEVSPAFTGRCNLYASSAGLAALEAVELERINALDEALTVATVPPLASVSPGQMLATVKVIPFAVSHATLRSALELLSGPAVEVAAYRPRRTVMVCTRLPETKDGLLEKTVEVVRNRLRQLGGELDSVHFCDHEERALAETLERGLSADTGLALVFGATAITDREDVIPAALKRVGGRVTRFGMPVDPGNLLLIGDRGDVPVIGLPGCARSPKLNGFDWVLRRVFAGLPVDSGTIARMGVGGLLQDTPHRTRPRERVPRRASVAALVLAAGRSRRMGADNKLLARWNGKPLVRHVVEAALQSDAESVYVVTGHQCNRVAEALADLPAVIVHNPNYAEGMASSLQTGLRAVPKAVDGVLVCLGDMPRVTPASLSKLIAAYAPAEGRRVCVPSHEGKRGNPVLIGRSLFPELERIHGDRGARSVIATHEEWVSEVAVDDPGILVDADTPAAVRGLASPAAGLEEQT